jgi:hypothetical protein
MKGSSIREGICFPSFDQSEIMVCRLSSSITGLTRRDNGGSCANNICVVALADFGYIGQGEFEALPSGKNIAMIRRV